MPEGRAKTTVTYGPIRVPPDVTEAELQALYQDYIDTMPSDAFISNYACLFRDYQTYDAWLSKFVVYDESAGTDTGSGTDGPEPDPPLAPEPAPAPAEPEESETENKPIGGNNMIDTSTVRAVTEGAIAQLIGKNYMSADYKLAALDTAAIVDIGEKLNINTAGDVTNGSPADIFFKSLLSQIANVVVDTRSYVKQLPKMFKSTTEWGLMTEMIRVDLSDVLDDPMWDPATFAYTDATSQLAKGTELAGKNFAVYKPKIDARIYKKAKAVMVALTVARDQMFTAFRGIDEYNQFVAGLWASVNNTIAIKAEIYAMQGLCAGIAVANEAGNNIQLITEYKAAIGADTALTPAEALQDAGFLKFALRRISDVRDNLQRYSAAYNDHSMATFSADTNLVMLAQVANACKFNVLADTYHNELIGVGEYDKVTAWQAVTSTVANSGAKGAYNLADASKILMTKTAYNEIASPTTAKTTNVTISNVIGILYDDYALGVNIDKSKVTSNYSAVSDHTNYFTHNLFNMVCNPGYAIVTFTLS